MTISYTQLTEQDRVQIVNLFMSRVECRQIQAMMGLSKRAVQRVMKEAGVNTRRRNRYTLDEDYFDVIDTPEKAYWLGFLYADGYVVSTVTREYTSLATKSTQVLVC